MVCTRHPGAVEGHEAGTLARSSSSESACLIRKRQEVQVLPSQRSGARVSLPSGRLILARLVALAPLHN